MGEKRDILFLCQFFYPEYISSAQLPYDTARALCQAGFTVDVLCGYPREYLDGGDIPCREEVEGIRIHRLKYLQLDRSGFLGRLVNYFSFTWKVMLHLFTLSRYRAAVVYSNPPVLPWVVSWGKKLFGTKLVFVSYDLYPEVATVTHTLGSGNPICLLMNHINRRVFQRADRIVALSGEMRDYILKNRPVSGQRVTVIPNWYADQREFPKSEGHNRFRELAAGRFVVAYFGNMGTMQDMDTILTAIRELEKDGSVFFLFAGHGNKMEELRAITAGENIRNIEIHTFLHGKDFLEALDASDCALVTLEKGATGLCVPSKTYCYMMEGIPLLAIMDECDIVRDIEAGAGLWVRNGEGHRLAEDIRALKQDPDRLARMRKKCREIYLRKYTTEICTGQYTALMRELLGKKKES